MKPEEYLAALRNSMVLRRPEQERFGVVTKEQMAEYFRRRVLEDADDAESLISLAPERSLHELLQEVERASGHSLLLDLALRSTFQEVHQVTLELAEFANKSPLELPTLASLPTFEPNACTLRVPGSRDVIVAFADGLPLFLSLIAKALVRVYEEISPEELAEQHSRSDWPDVCLSFMKQAISDLEEEWIRFAVIVGSFVRASKPPLKRRPLNAASDMLRSFLITGAERFIMGHEYGHIYLGHSGLACVSETMEIYDTKVEVLRRDQGQEYAADVVGRNLSLVLAAKDWLRGGSKPRPDCYAIEVAGPSLFFTAAEILDDA